MIACVGVPLVSCILDRIFGWSMGGLPLGLVSYVLIVLGVIGAAYAVVAWLVTAISLQPDGRTCWSCGYDLSNHADARRCPECGLRFGPSRRRRDPL